MELTTYCYILCLVEIWKASAAFSVYISLEYFMNYSWQISVCFDHRGTWSFAQNISQYIIKHAACAAGLYCIWCLTLFRFTYVQICNCIKEENIILPCKQSLSCFWWYFSGKTGLVATNMVTYDSIKMLMKVYELSVPWLRLAFNYYRSTFWIDLQDCHNVL